MAFPWPEVGTPLADVITPMPVIDEDRMARNIARAQTYMNSIGRAFRPHIKTHKLASVAQMQIDHGAVGINCQKVTELSLIHI